MLMKEALPEDLLERGRRIVGENAEMILKQAVRKCEMNGKGAEYLPVLFENEISDYLMRGAINDMGRLNYERRNAVGA